MSLRAPGLADGVFRFVGLTSLIESVAKFAGFGSVVESVVGFVGFGSITEGVLDLADFGSAAEFVVGFVFVVGEFVECEVVSSFESMLMTMGRGSSSISPSGGEAPDVEAGV